MRKFDFSGKLKHVSFAVLKRQAKQTEVGGKRKFRAQF